jgi:curved DNA-binding protein CbpA
MQTHYDVLGVSWKSNDDQIRAAFRRTVKTCHPDLHAGDRAAERRLRQVLASYEVLRKPQKRQVYDRHLKAERQARNQRVGLTAFTGLVCFTAIASLMLWLPKMTQDASAGPQPAAIAIAIADAHEQVQVAFTSHIARTEINSSSHVARTEINGSSHVARTEINGSSKSDRVAAASKASNNQVVAEETPRPASKPRPTPARHAEPQRRLAKEWGQVRQSDDPMAIAAFAARHPDASESKLARSKLIGLIETADDMSLLSILGLGDGEIAERAQQRLTRLRAHTKEETKEEAAPSDALKERAASFVSARVAGWSSTSIINIAAHTRAYADEVLYNGNLKSRQAVAREKRRQLELWPERSYEVRPDSITARCLANVCKVGGIVDWQTRSAARDASASGMARFDYEVALARGTFRILSESLSDLKRPRQAASCLTKGGEVTATSQKIREFHRDAQRCLQLVGKGAAPKLKTALLARAQVLQRTQQEDAHVVSSFDERWVQAALLR